MRSLKESEESTLLDFFKGFGGEVRLRVRSGLAMHVFGGGRKVRLRVRLRARSLKESEE